jgi:hypothetical protein
MKRILNLVAVCAAGMLVAAEPTPTESLSRYRAELAAFRQEFGGERNLPEVRFFLFGMGQRSKWIYRNGKLINALTQKALYEWTVGKETIVPPQYLVELDLADGKKVRLVEDEAAFWVEADGKRTAVEGTRSPVKLPSFGTHRYPGVLRVLHQELLVNVTPAGPVPNYLVYAKPWYRDGAMMAMAFQKTGNLPVIRDWIQKLGEPFDRNNAGETEADNLGQALFLISLASDKAHPLVETILKEAKRFEVVAPGGRYIQGRSDFAERPVYQTKWLKYGLKALNLPDPYTIPAKPDGYSALFWMDYRDHHLPGRDDDNRKEYAYLGWACDHFHGTKKSPISNRDYPLTWEQNASQAKYEGTRIISPEYVQQKLCAPHTWHAAEVFLYLLDSEAQPKGK